MVNAFLEGTVHIFHLTKMWVSVGWQRSMLLGESWLPKWSTTKLHVVSPVSTSGVHKFKGESNYKPA